MVQVHIDSDEYQEHAEDSNQDDSSYININMPDPEVNYYGC